MLPILRLTILAAAFSLAFSAGLILAAASSGEPRPYGPAPASLTWHYPPTSATFLPGDGGSARLPRAVTEKDAWLTDRDGQPRYRLYQSVGRRCFSRRPGARCRVRYGKRRNGRGLRVTSAYDAARYGIVVYGWRS